MSKRQMWIDRALDELASVEEMGKDAADSCIGGDARSAHMVSALIQYHAQDARRYLSYALRCKEDD